MTFHNTVPISGAELLERIAGIKTQDELILFIFTNHTGYEYSACQVWQIINDRRPNKMPIPLTSIRRGISNLKKESKLVKTGNKVKGIYGDQVNTWKAPHKEPDQKSLFQ